MLITHSNNKLHVEFDFNAEKFIELAMAALGIALLVFFTVAAAKYPGHKASIAPPAKIEASAQALLPLGMNAEGDVALLLSSTTSFDSVNDTQQPYYIAAPE